MSDPAIPGDAPFLRECRALHSAWQRFASGRAGIWTIFIWSLSEATWWPVIPEAALVPLAAVSTRRVPLLLAAIAGSALGASATFIFAYAAPSLAQDWLSHLPLVFDRNIAQVNAQLDAHGVRALLTQPWSGVSFKIWGVEAGRRHWSPFVVIPMFVGARAVRMSFFTLLAAFAADRAKTFVRDFSIFVLASYTVLFTFGWWQVLTR